MTSRKAYYCCIISTCGCIFWVPDNSIYPTIFGSHSQNSEIHVKHFEQLPEPIQSRCAVLRYSKLTDAQLLKRLLEITEAESVSTTDDGLEAIVFTAQGDMRQVSTRNKQ